MSVTPLPPAPNRNDPTNFPILADPFMSALPTFGTECNALQVDVNAQQVTATNAAGTSTAQAVIATTQASIATTQAGIASAAVASGSGSPAWVSGTTYVVGNVVYSPSDFRSYRRITAGAGTTDPSADNVNWFLVSNGPSGCLIIHEQQPSGTAATFLTLGSWNTRILNTVVSNTINGASVASNTITLPAGTYEVFVTAFAASGGSGDFAGRHVLYNNTDSSNAILGGNTTVTGRLTSISSKDFSVRTFIGGSGTGSGGKISGSGINEVYTQIVIKRVG